MPTQREPNKTAGAIQTHQQAAITMGNSDN